MSVTRHLALENGVHASTNEKGRPMDPSKAAFVYVL